MRSKNIHAQTLKELFKKKHSLYLLYAEENEPLDTLRNNLKKLLDFTENYGINQIAIKAKELRELYYVYDKDSLKNLIAELDELDMDLSKDY